MYNVIITLLLLGAPFQDDNAGIDIRIFKPPLYFRFNDRNDLIVIEEMLLKTLAVINIEPGIGNNKAEASTVLQKLCAMHKEVSVNACTLRNVCYFLIAVV